MNSKKTKEIKNNLQCCAMKCRDCKQCTLINQHPFACVADLIRQTLKYVEVLEQSNKKWQELCADEVKCNTMKFILNGCDISFIAEAPEDITLKQLLKQCDKIKPDWCACGICSYEKEYGKNTDYEHEIIIGYDSIKKANKDVSCTIIGE